MFCRKWGFVVPKFVSAVLCVFSVFVSLTASAQTRFSPSTTLTAETANNTSAADTFVTAKNGNIAPGNVSKVPTRTLLYPGSTAQLYAHLVPWFGFGDHMDVGYNSADVLQVQKQVTDMVSRGLDGVIIDWYGRGASKRHFFSYDQATQTIMHEAEQHPGFTFALMADVGALKQCFNTPECDITETLIEDLNYASRTYEDSPAYLRYDKRPVIFFFGHEGHAIDWERVRHKVAGDPVFIFRNSGAFKHENGGGGFSWVSPLQASQDDPMALGYLENYYRTSLSHKESYSLGTGYKGFDDSVALWGSNRLIDQQCGQTWLQSIAEANKYYSVDYPLLGIQLVTWNDYEEGTEFESGVENCVKLSTSASGESIFWSAKGETSTIDHYTIFISRDGENLMPLADLANDARSLNLGKFALDPGEYTVYLKAVGKPSMTNKMSEGERITVAAHSRVSGPQTTLNASPNQGSVPATVTATVSSLYGELPSANTVIDFGDGTVLTGQNSVEHIYNLPGDYTIMVTTTDGSGYSSTQTTVIRVEQQAGK